MKSAVLVMAASLTLASSPAFARVSSECSKTLLKVRELDRATESAWKVWGSALDVYASKSGAATAKELGPKCQEKYYRLKLEDLQNEINEKQKDLRSMRQDMASLQYANGVGYAMNDSVQMTSFDITVNEKAIAYAKGQIAQTKKDRETAMDGTTDLVRMKGLALLQLEAVRIEYKKQLQALQTLQQSDTTCTQTEKSEIYLADAQANMSTNPMDHQGYKLYAFDADAVASLLEISNQPPPDDPALWELKNGSSCE